MEDHRTLGPIQPHTEAKHDILRYHLGAWFPILGRSSSGPLQYIDGFAGPGEYLGGEPGSPIIALQVVADHRYIQEFIQNGRRFDFLFVEKDQSFANHLERKVNETRWPKAFNIEVRRSEFETEVASLLDQIDTGIRQMPPTLLFIDPFGPAGFSMELLARLAKYPRIDVLINFNCVDVVRWILPDIAKHATLSRLYGSGRWRRALQLVGDECVDFLISEYGLALNDAGWRSTNFAMINKQNQTQYYLIFATRNPRGMQVIKSAFRSVSPDGLFRYADRNDPAQLRFIGMGMDVEYAEELAGHLASRYRDSSMSKESLVSNEVAWHPRWVESDLTRGLRLLESASPSRILDVTNPDGRPRRRNTYPPHCLITFAP